MKVMPTFLAVLFALSTCPLGAEDPDDKNIILLEKVGLTSLMKPMLGKPKVGTYVYRGEDSFLDQIIVNEHLQDEEGLSIVEESAYILDLPKYRRKVITSTIHSDSGQEIGFLVVTQTTLQ